MEDSAFPQDSFGAVLDCGEDGPPPVAEAEPNLSGICIITKQKKWQAQSNTVLYFYSVMNRRK